MKTRLTRTAIFRLLILVLPVVGFPSTGFAQTTTGTILGTVTDQAEAIVPGATVTVKNIETGVTRSITTDEAGRYRVAALLPGKYEVKAEREGFSTELRSGGGY